MLKGIEHFHYYLYGQRFTPRTDHASLGWLLNFHKPEGQIARWLQKLQEYDFEIQHRLGRSHGNADALSRRPCDEIDCTFCSQLEKKDEEVARLARSVVANEGMPTIIRQNQRHLFSKFGARKKSSKSKRRILISDHCCS